MKPSAWWPCIFFNLQRTFTAFSQRHHPHHLPAVSFFYSHASHHSTAPSARLTPAASSSSASSTSARMHLLLHSSTLLGSFCFLLNNTSCSCHHQPTAPAQQPSASTFFFFFCQLQLQTSTATIAFSPCTSHLHSSSPPPSSHSHCKPPSTNCQKVISQLTHAIAPLGLCQPTTSTATPSPLPAASSSRQQPTAIAFCLNLQQPLPSFNTTHQQTHTSPLPAQTLPSTSATFINSTSSTYDAMAATFSSEPLLMYCLSHHHHPLQPKLHTSNHFA